MYRQLTHVLCHNQFLYLSQQIKEERTDNRIPLGFWPYLLSKMKRMGTFVDFLADPDTTKSYDGSDHTFKREAFLGSNAKSIHQDCITVVFTILTNHMMTDSAFGSGQQHIPPLRNPGNYDTHPQHWIDIEEEEQRELEHNLVQQDYQNWPVDC